MRSGGASRMQSKGLAHAVRRSLAHAVGGSLAHAVGQSLAHAVRGDSDSSKQLPLTAPLAQHASHDACWGECVRQR